MHVYTWKEMKAWSFCKTFICYDTSLANMLFDRLLIKHIEIRHDTDFRNDVSVTIRTVSTHAAEHEGIRPLRKNIALSMQLWWSINGTCDITRCRLVQSYQVWYIPWWSASQNYVWKVTMMARFSWLMKLNSPSANWRVTTRKQRIWHVLYGHKHSVLYTFSSVSCSSISFEVTGHDYDFTNNVILDTRVHSKRCRYT